MTASLFIPPLYGFSLKSQAGPPQANPPHPKPTLPTPTYKDGEEVAYEVVFIIFFFLRT